MEKYYDILGLKYSATELEIKSVYKKLAKIYHPDMRDTGNEEMFKKVNEAYKKIEKNNFIFYSSSSNYNKKEEKTNYNHSKNNNANSSFDNKEKYKDITSGIILGVVDGIFSIIKNIFSFRIFKNIFTFVYKIYLFIFNTIIRFFKRYNWSIIILIFVWPLGLFLLFLELFRYNEPIEKVKPTQSKNLSLIEILVVIGVIGILAGILFVAIDPKQNTNNYKTPIIKTKQIFNKQPLLPLKNGWYKKHYNGRGVAPITIKTKEKGVYYYVKIEDAYSGKLIKEIFIHGGKGMSTKLPLGDYIIKYATGKKWYGFKDLFGPKPMTTYSKADEIFNFYQTPNGYMGYTIELFLQHNGNLKTKNISPDEF